MKINFLLSLGIHGLFCAVIFFVSAKTETPKQEVIQFEIQAPTKTRKLDFGGTSSGKNGKSGGTTKSIGSNINLFGSGYVADSKVVRSDADRPDADYTDHANYIPDSGSFISDSNQQAYFAEVFHKIDEQLLFDSILAQYGHFGVVHVEFEVDENGRFVKSGLRVSTNDAILKVHVLRAMIKGLSESFVKEKWNPTGRHQIFQAQFQFVRDDFENNYRPSQENFGKPILSFRRSTLEQPIPTNLKDQLLTGGVGYDLFAVTERWQKYNKRKKLREQEFDPFATYKSDPLYKL